ncbi:MAG: uroporphyrinogen-III C-methyltransferase [Chitinophagaceae bacterium]|nr:uroporphyrinogen-III C-methyltransferase [Chitinophagaceae bacterium]
MAVLSLVGAGPGDPDLITLKAIKCLRQADVILYDALANDELLQYASPKAIKHFAGKRMGCHSLSQREINMLILDYGRKYNRIVRLKGGDPFVFGRAQEEIDAARSAGMEIEVIPGISSCIAGPASQMIPLTCRGINESFWVTTGTTRSGEISPDIYLAAQSSATVVILMAMSRLESIMDVFKAAGREETAAAIIQDATSPSAKTAIGKVKDIVFRAELQGMSNPAIIVIGEVVNLHPSFISDQLIRNTASVSAAG